MGITRKFILPVMILILATVPILVKTYAKKPLAIFNGEEVSVVDNGFEFKIKAYGNTVIEILRNGGIDVKQQDIVFPNGTLKENQKIIILRAIPLIIKTKSGKKKIYTTKETVGEVLKENGIKISGNSLNYSLSEKVYPGMKIIVSKMVKKITLAKSTLKNVNQPTIINRVVEPKSKPKVESTSEIKTTGEVQSGIASWYSYIPGNYCASLRFPRGTRLRVTNIANGKSVIVVVNDSGPFNGRAIDLERNAFSQIASLSQGTARVRVERIR